MKTKEYAAKNEMQINLKKTKAILFNSCTSVDFMPEMRLDNQDVEVVEELRLLGVIIRSDMTWVSNTDNMIKKANKRLWILRRLKFLGAQQDDLVDLYMKQIRSVLELAVPAWQEERVNIERIQKCAANIILGRSISRTEKHLNL